MKTEKIDFLIGYLQEMKKEMEHSSPPSDFRALTPGRKVLEIETREVLPVTDGDMDGLFLQRENCREHVTWEELERGYQVVKEDPLAEWKSLKPGRKVQHLPTKTVWTITRVGDYGTHIVSDDSGDEIFLVSSNNPLRYYRILPVTTRSFFRGHPVIKSADGAWIYEDSGEPAGFDGTIRPCKKCGLIFDGSDAGHPDPCLGNLPGVDNACCGHGVRSEAYIRFTNGVVIRGFEIVQRKVGE